MAPTLRRVCTYILCLATVFASANKDPIQHAVQNNQSISEVWLGSEITSFVSMSPVTELVTLKLKPGVEWESTFQKLGSVLRKQPGCHQARYAKKHEKPDEVVMFIDWEDVAAHKAATSNDDFVQQKGEIVKLVTAKPQTYHVSFEPTPPTVLNNEEGKRITAVSEVCHAYFPADLSMEHQQDALTRVQQFIDETKPVAKGFPGETAHGWVLENVEYEGEKSRALVLVLGWDSIDAHMAYRETEQFAKSVPLMREMQRLKKVEVFHVSNHVVDA